MALGKSKKQYKKGQKKRVVDPMSRKEWYDMKAPVPFNPKSFGKTCVTKSGGQRIASDDLKGRVVEQSLADLKEENTQNSWRKIKLIVDDVEGRTVKTTFYGMNITRDRLYQHIKKWQTLIETFVNVKSADGYIFRIFTLAFTKRHKDQKRKTYYAQQQQIKIIRKRINDIFLAEIPKLKINEIIKNLIMHEYYPEKIVKACQNIYPLANVVVRKVKVLKRPAIDSQKLIEMYSHERKVAHEKGAKKEIEQEDEDAENLLKKKE